MQLKPPYLATACLTLALSGCANLTTLERQTHLDFDNSDFKSGKAIHLDAKQRLVIQKDFGIVCAEPSPDALSVAAAGISGSAATASQKTTALQSVFGEAGGSIGLRTQSIQLMRDALYRVCEAYFSKALNDSQLMVLHQKYQDVMVAFLAIEQLTGAVAPAALALNTTAKADAIASAKELGEAVRDARERVAAATEAKEAAGQAVTTAQTNHTNSKQAAEQAADDAANKQELTAKAAADLEILTEKQEEHTVAAQNLEDEQKRLDAYIKTEDTTLAQVSGKASGSANLSNIIKVENIDQHTATDISDAVENIVKAVVQKDYTAQSCMGILADIDDLNQLLKDKHYLEEEKVEHLTKHTDLDTRYGNKLKALDAQIELAKPDKTKRSLLQDLLAQKEKLVDDEIKRDDKYNRKLKELNDRITSTANQNRLVTVCLKTFELKVEQAFEKMAKQ